MPQLFNPLLSQLLQKHTIRAELDLDYSHLGKWYSNSTRTLTSNDQAMDHQHCNYQGPTRDCPCFLTVSRFEDLLISHHKVSPAKTKLMTTLKPSKSPFVDVHFNILLPQLRQDISLLKCMSLHQYTSSPSSSHTSQQATVASPYPNLKFSSTAGTASQGRSTLILALLASLARKLSSRIFISTPNLRRR